MRVRVVARASRGKYVFRWKDPDSGGEQQKNSEIEIGGPSSREERKTRNAAERAAVEFAKELVAQRAAKKAAEEAEARLGDHSFPTQIDAYLDTVRLGGASKFHMANVRAQLERFAREARTREDESLAVVTEVTEDVIVRFIDGLMKTPQPRKEKPPKVWKRNFKTPRPDPPPPPPLPERKPEAASIQTKNHYLTAVKAFLTFLVDKDILVKNPGRKLTRPSPEVDLRRERRALSPDEFSKLIAAAYAGVQVEKMSGPDRAMMYVVASWTGYRRKELASLTPLSFDLDGEEPCVRVKAGSSKHRKLSEIPLHSSLVEGVRSWLTSKGFGPDDPVFDLRAKRGELRNTAKMMRADLKAAGLPYQNEEGLYADFHSNRAAFITNLVRSGIPFFRVVKLARHSDPKLTAKYDKASRKQLAEDVERLPEPPAMGGP